MKERTITVKEKASSMISPLLCKLCDNKHRDEQSEVFNNNDSNQSVFHGILSHIISGNKIANLIGQVLKHISAFGNGCVIVFVKGQEDTVVDHHKRIHESNVAELIGEALVVVHTFVVARRSDRVNNRSGDQVMRLTIFFFLQDSCQLARAGSAGLARTLHAARRCDLDQGVITVACWAHPWQPSPYRGQAYSEGQHAQSPSPQP